MQFEKLSMLKKIFLSMLPVVLGGVFVSYVINKMATQVDERLSNAVEMVRLVNQAELEMVKMSEALRGYLLNPANTDEFKRKKEADAAYGAAAEELSKLVTENKEILELNDKMAKYDASDLDKIENEVADLIANKDPKAVDFYAKTYTPARKVQADNFVELKKMVLNYSASIIDDNQIHKVSDARRTIFMLFASILIGLGFMVFITKSAVGKIQTISAEIGNNIGEVENFAVNMADLSKRLSESTTEQAASLQQTAASLDQITAMVGKAADSANQSSDSANESQQKAQASKDAMNRMLDSINEISAGNAQIMDQVQSSNDQMSQVVEVIKEIGNKTKVINEIVFQTKLLSFNASVEAARAGEHGKGFAVVAEEVGSLAQMSGNAAKEISDLLSESITKVEAVVTDSKSKVQALMNENKEKVNVGVQIAGECSAGLDEIVSQINHMTDLSREISTAAQEQTSGLAEISKAMSQLDTATQRNASTSEETAAGASNLAEKTKILNESILALTAAISGSSSNNNSFQKIAIDQLVET